jgi:DNA (cytosine-5)-methyltransferase 1
MRELSLFSGAGGGLLGSLLLGWQPIGYVESNDYCQRVIAQRIADGILPNAPIFGDIRTFVSEGYAAAYTGLVDVISGGFPCQPFSVAGKRAGADDPRNMWPATAECVRIVRPRYCFFENVPSLLNSGYFGRIVADLAACGYGVRWDMFSACAIGAPHPRERLFIVAYPKSSGRREQCGRQQHEANGNQERHIHYWRRESQPTRVAHGVAHRVERIRAIGNGQVPAVAATAWRLLTEATNAN